MTALFSCANFPVGAQMFGFHIVLRLRTIYLVVVQLCFYAFYDFLKATFAVNSTVLAQRLSSVFQMFQHLNNYG